MLDITTIVLTYNEELHIRRCLENVCSFSKKVYVVDSPSTDKTVEICKEFPNVEVVVHPYPGNQAAQFNWALDHLSIDTEWVLRLDADEYLLPELVAEIRRKLPVMPEDVKGLEMRRRHIFMGRWVKHGVYPVVLMRMFRTGCARYEERLMDEHLVLNEGHTLLLDHDFCDHSLVDLSAYCTKHLLYARREAAELLADAYGLERTSGMPEGAHIMGRQAMEKRRKKHSYSRLPLFWRSFAYFCYRYILKGGFLDGKEGFLFAFIQGWWYRTVVDAKILECRKYIKAAQLPPHSEAEKAAVRTFIRRRWNISL